MKGHTRSESDSNPTNKHSWASPEKVVHPQFMQNQGNEEHEDEVGQNGRDHTSGA
jgi:hypothetical protein